MITKKLYEGFLFGLGILLAFSVIGTVFAVGFHYAEEIREGTFSGDFIFDGNVNITTGNDMCLQSGKCLSNARDSSVLITGADILDNSITSTDLATNSVGTSEINDGSISSADINSAQVQRRVTGTCPSGQSIRAISSTGTVTCEVDNVGVSGSNVDFSDGGTLWTFSVVSGFQVISPSPLRAGARAAMINIWRQDNGCRSVRLRFKSTDNTEDYGLVFDFVTSGDSTISTAFMIVPLDSNGRFAVDSTASCGTIYASTIGYIY